MKCVIIVNPKSGKGKILKYKNYIIFSLEQKFEVVWKETEYAGHGLELAKEYGEKCEYMIVAGGDGTLNEVINGVLQNETQPILAQIPSGTVNDFASSLGFKKNIKKCVKQLLNSSPIEINVFRSGEKFGIYICGIGVFTQTSYTASQSRKNRFGVLTYFFNGLKEIKTYKPNDVKLKINDREIQTKICLMIFLNSRSVGGFKFNKNANLSDDLMDFVLISTKKDKICLKDLFLIARLFLFGIKSISKNKRVYTCQSSSIRIESSEKFMINFDGELAANKDNIEVEVYDKKLKFLSYK